MSNTVAFPEDENNYYERNESNQRRSTDDLILNTLHNIQYRMQADKKDTDAKIDKVHVENQKSITELKDQIHQLDVVVNNGLTHRTKETHQVALDNHERVQSMEKMLAHAVTKEELEKKEAAQTDAVRYQRKLKHWRNSLFATVGLGVLGMILRYREGILRVVDAMLGGS